MLVHLSFKLLFFVVFFCFLLVSHLLLNKKFWFQLTEIFNPGPAEPGYTLPLQTV